jgi:hypothetical protein
VLFNHTHTHSQMRTRIYTHTHTHKYRALSTLCLSSHREQVPRACAPPRQDECEYGGGSGAERGGNGSTGNTFSQLIVVDSKEGTGVEAVLRSDEARGVCVNFCVCVCVCVRVCVCL